MSEQAEIAYFESHSPGDTAAHLLDCAEKATDPEAQSYYRMMKLIAPAFQEATQAELGRHRQPGLVLMHSAMCFEQLLSGLIVELTKPAMRREAAQHMATLMARHIPELVERIGAHLDTKRREA